MHKRLLGFCGLMLFALLGLGSGVAEAHPDAMLEDMTSDGMILEGMTSEDMSTEDMEPAYKEVRCLVRGSFDCMAQCVSIGANCSQFVLHPYRVEGGQGALYWCKGGSRPTYTCSYRFANGEHCHYLKPFGIPYCVYEGGK